MNGIYAYSLYLRSLTAFSVYWSLSSRKLTNDPRPLLHLRRGSAYDLLGRSGSGYTECVVWLPFSLWNRPFLFSQEFFLPSESFDLVFLKAKIAILCTKGFEIMDLTEYELVDVERYLSLTSFPPASKVSRFRFVTMVMNGWRNVVNRANRWACSVLKTNSCCVMMVRHDYIDLVYSSHNHRIWHLREQAWGAEPFYGDDRVGGHRRARSYALALHPSLRLAFH